MASETPGAEMPEALRLADWLQSRAESVEHINAAAELRRLYALSAAAPAANLGALPGGHPALAPDMLVNGGALTLAVNVLRRAGKDEVADELLATAVRADQGAAAPAAPADYPHEAMDAMALARYKVVPSHDSMLHRHAVVAGDGTQQLYLGREVECQNMARKFAGAFLDGAFALFHSLALTAPQAQQPGATYTHADVAQAHADGYKLGMSQVDRAGTQAVPPPGHLQMNEGAVKTYPCLHEWDGKERLSLPPQYACKKCGEFFPTPPNTPDFQGQPVSAAHAAVSAPSGIDALLEAIRKLPAVRAAEIDGEESDGTPKHWRSRPYISLTQLERLLRAELVAVPATAAPAAVSAPHGNRPRQGGTEALESHARMDRQPYQTSSSAPALPAGPAPAGIHLNGQPQPQPAPPPSGAFSFWSPS